MKKLSKKLLASVLACSMLFGVLTACGQKSGGGSSATSGAATNADNGNSDKKIEVKGQVVIGTDTEPKGDLSVPYWQNGGTDAEISRSLLSGYSVLEPNRDGEYVENPTALEKMVRKENEDKTVTYTFTIKDGLKYSDGSAITAADYVAGAIFFGHPVLNEAKAKTALSGASQYVGWEDYNGNKTKEMKGVRLLDKLTFSVTLAEGKTPHYFEYSNVAVGPFPWKYWTQNDKGGEVEIKDDGNGAYFSDNFTAENCVDRIQKTRFDVKQPVAGPYMVESFDQANQTETLVINPEFQGNFEGQKPHIERIIYKKINSATAMDELKTGSIDMYSQVMDGEVIEKGLNMVDDESANVDYVDYPRSGYGKLQFVCDFGPTQFVEVRQAIAYLLDRQDFVQTFTKGHGNVVNGPYGEGQWYYKQGEKELSSKLNSYSYSLENAKKVLEAGGWTLDKDGNPYSGEGLRYKKVNDELMPLSIRWCSSEQNPVSDLLVTKLVQNKDLKAAGMEIKQDVMKFDELLNYIYRDGSAGDKYAEPAYHMFNLASRFPVAFVPEYTYTTDEDLIKQGQNTNYIRDEELAKLSSSYFRVKPDEKDKFVEGFVKYIERWNQLLPDLPLYSNQVHDFFNKKIKNYANSSNSDTAKGLLYAHIED